MKEVKLETPATLDPNKLRPLAELLPPDEWKRGFAEAHEETITTQVPARVKITPKLYDPATGRPVGVTSIDCFKCKRGKE